MNPTFGDKVEEAHYQTRYGVYAVIPNQDKTKIILVQAPNEAWFLPGGEIEAGENHFSALKRELIEEIGYTATLGQYYGQADAWFPIDEAIAKLKRGSHKWGIEQLKESNTLIAKS